MKQESDLRMKHTDPGFWEFVSAYLLLLSGGLLTAINLLECAFTGEEFDEVGIYAFCAGIGMLPLLRRQRGSQLTVSAQGPPPG